jgi:hypothetical protein
LTRKRFGKLFADKNVAKVTPNSLLVLPPNKGEGQIENLDFF